MKLADAGMHEGTRVPPHNLEAERSLIGAMLIVAETIVEARAVLSPSDFYGRPHGALCAAIYSLHDQGEAVDVVGVVELLRRQGEYEDHLAAEMNAMVIESAPHAARRHVAIVAECAEQRRYIALADELKARAYGREDPVHLATWLEERRPRPAARPDRQLLRTEGGRFIFDAPAGVEAVWGYGEAVVWSAGEPFFLVGPSGVGKTTLAQQLTLARCGLRSELLGFAVAPDDRAVLYIAADRPAQAQRSFRRMVSEAERGVLDRRLVVWRGPLPEFIDRNPNLLLNMAEQCGAGTVVVDSLKDVACKLTEDETGQRVNQALQVLVAAGVEVAVLHHQRKGQQGVGKPRALADVYGSVWITAGAGSVALVWGEPGDAVVELSHLKQPLEDVGPLTLLHDHGAGHTTVQGSVDLWDVVRTSNGLTAEGAARAIFGVEGVQPNQVEKARRRLDGLVKKGSVYKKDAGKDATGRQQPARYYVVASAGETVSRPVDSDHGACGGCGAKVWKPGGSVPADVLCPRCEHGQVG